MMRLRFPLFVDPRPNAEADVEFAIDEIESVEETTRSRIFAGSFQETRVILRGKRESLWSGHFARKIEAARKR